MKRWTLVACALGIGFFVIALSNEVYDITSPYALSWHVALRKFYSIVAFSLVGFATRKAFDERGIRRSSTLDVGTVAVYSGVIELGQYLMGSQEGLIWNGIDVACGGIGGLIGGALARLGTPTR